MGGCVKHRSKKKQGQSKQAHTRHPYLPRVLAIGSVSAGQVAQVAVVHEEGCRRPYGGACTCVPDMTVAIEGGMADVDASGWVGDPVVPS